MISIYSSGISESEVPLFLPIIALLIKKALLLHSKIVTTKYFFYMALITCPECGKQISEKARECPHCGNPLNPSYYPQQQHNIQPSNNSKPGWLLPVLIAAVAVLAATLGFIIFNRSQQPAQNDFTSTSASVGIESPYQGGATSPATAAQPIEKSRTHAQSEPSVKYRDPSTLVRYCINTINYGYVNVRRKPSTKSGVVKVLYDYDSFYGHPMSSTNWIEYVENGRVIGYVREDCVRKPGQSRYFY